jgi:hypothetical protein
MRPNSEGGSAKGEADGGQKQDAFKLLLSRNGEPAHVATHSEKPPKMKSVMVMFDCLNGAQGRCDNSSDWQLVKPKRKVHAVGRALLVGPLMRRFEKPNSCLHQHQPAYKEVFPGKCFCCLTSNHKVATCHEPHRCLNCLGSGYLARHYKVRALKPSIRSRLTFPPGSIHNRITFPELSYTVAVSGPSSPCPSLLCMASSGCYVAEKSDQRPSQYKAIVVATGAMMAELQKLWRKAVMPCTVNNNVVHHPEEVAYALHSQLCVPLEHHRLRPQAGELLHPL